MTAFLRKPMAIPREPVAHRSNGTTVSHQATGPFDCLSCHQRAAWRDLTEQIGYGLLLATLAVVAAVLILGAIAIVAAVLNRYFSSL